MDKDYIDIGPTPFRFYVLGFCVIIIIAAALAGLRFPEVVNGWFV